MKYTFPFELIRPLTHRRSGAYCRTSGTTAATLVGVLYEFTYTTDVPMLTHALGYVRWPRPLLQRFVANNQPTYYQLKPPTLPIRPRIHRSSDGSWCTSGTTAATPRCDVFSRTSGTRNNFYLYAFLRF